MTPEQQCLEWFKRRYGAVTPRQDYTINLSCWDVDKKSEFRFYPLHKMVSMVHDAFSLNNKGYNVFYGIGLGKGKQRDNIARYSTCDIECFPFSAIDFDFGKPKTAKTMEQAIAALEIVPFAIDGITFTGHGLHLYFQLPEQHIYNKHQIKSINEATHNYVKTYFGNKYQWTVDSTQDLARLDRIPGTLNYTKGEDTILGRIL
jgi:putative DNA primase/helicase